ncbi:MAG: branched-chain amino acid ABC transporter permease [Nitrospirota bacterium]
MDIWAQIIINSIITGAIYALIVLGFNLIYWVTKFFNIAHGVYAVVAAYTVYFMYTTKGSNVYLSIIAAILAAGLAGLLSDRFVFLPLRKRTASGMTMFVASLGIFTVLQAVVALIFTNQYRMLRKTYTAGKTFNILGGVITETHCIVIIVVFVTLAVLIILRDRTKFGRAVKAIGDDEEVAKIVGINTNKIIATVFFIGAASTGIGGILIGFDTGMMPASGMSLLLNAVTASIIGGAGNILGGLLGSFMLGFAQNASVWWISGEWQDAIAFVMLIIFLLFRPRGIFNE